MPAAGASNAIVTVEFTEPPLTEGGFSLIDAIFAGFKVSAADLDEPLREAVIVTFVVSPTERVTSVKLALVAPAAILTLTGVVELELSSVSVTINPPDGAGALSFTVPIEAVPPVTVAGLNVSA